MTTPITWDAYPDVYGEPQNSDATHEVNQDKQYTLPEMQKIKRTIDCALHTKKRRHIIAADKPAAGTYKVDPSTWINLPYNHESAMPLWSQQSYRTHPRMLMGDRQRRSIPVPRGPASNYKCLLEERIRNATSRGEGRRIPLNRTTFGVGDRNEYRDPVLNIRIPRAHEIGEGVQNRRIVRIDGNRTEESYGLDRLVQDGDNEIEITVGHTLIQGRMSHIIQGVRKNTPAAGLSDKDIKLFLVMTIAIALPILNRVFSQANPEEYLKSTDFCQFLVDYTAAEGLIIAFTKTVKRWGFNQRKCLIAFNFALFAIPNAIAFIMNPHDVITQKLVAAPDDGQMPWWLPITPQQSLLCASGGSPFVDCPFLVRLQWQRTRASGPANHLLNTVGDCVSVALATVFRIVNNIFFTNAATTYAYPT
jgi:hypothetical protein